MAGVLARGTFLYFGAVNAGTVGLFAYDKHQAVQRGQRVPERTLCQTALLGGWPAGLMAMQLFRHKTRKKSFQKKYVDAMSVNAMVTIPLGIALSVSPPMRTAFTRLLFSRKPYPPGRWGGAGGRKPPRMRR